MSGIEEACWSTVGFEHQKQRGPSSFPRNLAVAPTQRLGPSSHASRRLLSPQREQPQPCPAVTRTKAARLRGERAAFRGRLSTVERHDMNTLSLPLNIRRGGSDTNLNFDVPDGVLEFHKVKLNADSLKQKILKVTEQIKVEQTARDGNVAEYLKLVNSADKQQAGRIKQVFEKKNQKSAHSIAQLQKKLEQYHKKLKDIEQNGSSKATKDTSKDNLKDVQHGKSRSTGHGAESSKSGVPGVSLTPPVFVFSKSREFANLIRNKFGSADNIAHLKNTLDEFRPETSSRTYGGSATIVAKPKYVSDDECSSGTSGSADSNGNTSFSPAVANTLDSQGKLSMILEELREIKETQSQLADDIENLKTQFKRDYAFISQMLQEERFRYERLEDQLNDLTDLHQHETANLKQELASIEEKVAYQAYERSRDVQPWNHARPGFPNWSCISRNSKHSSLKQLMPKCSWGSV
ncbi:transmembrane and coiled-coil domain protein 3 [Geospiza fortis]|uniref:Transmembrane and coiled-coil domain protein 3 n=1 Tax=Geospiza fortis TaxID=48883 RepID=A0A8N5ESP9_GEOFO|nr:transmembrane and coiled-coil domain protein 3 [Geospiza fortis]